LHLPHTWIETRAGRRGWSRPAKLVHHFNAASGYAGACSQHQREASHYERGRKDGLAEALELVDAILRSGERQPARRRPVEEIVASVEAIAEGAGGGIGASASRRVL
jgi:hypothetical protein